MKTISRTFTLDNLDELHNLEKKAVASSSVFSKKYYKKLSATQKKSIKTKMIVYIKRFSSTIGSYRVYDKTLYFK